MTADRRLTVSTWRNWRVNLVAVIAVGLWLPLARLDWRTLSTASTRPNGCCSIRSSAGSTCTCHARRISAKWWCWTATIASVTRVRLEVLSYFGTGAAIAGVEVPW